MMPRKARISTSLFGARPVPVPFIAAMIIIEIIYSLCVNLIYFEHGYYRPLSNLTYGWIGGTLSANLIGLFVEVIIFLVAIAKVTPRELGLRKEKLLPGLTGFLLFWIAIQLVNLGVNLSTGSSITFNDQITEFPSVVLGGLLGQLFGNALLEEIIFRGFLFVQVFLLCSKIKRHSSRVTAAMFISQSIFALMHIPNRIYSGLTGMEFVYDFIQLVILGIIFCLLYLLTKNLFFVVGIHSLMNEQLMLWYNDYSDVIILSSIITMVCLMLLLKIKHRRTHRAAIEI
ncbi:CPBP family intramembrane glutamic endopeptidase [Paenibacillus ihuae]|uniref:CPBP family intramembrane glutamic endopeptidase n=1 Tax=Paenibacillus ihuae TaxID=1232431 RepID=UPI0006D53CCF|nr:CPBP family intramembrane glutamic endopeptidase [Paenibacillus ihuae]